MYSNCRMFVFGKWMLLLVKRCAQHGEFLQTKKNDRTFEITQWLRRMWNRIWYGSSGKHCCYIDSAYLAHLCQHGKPAQTPLVQSNQSSLVLSHVTLLSGTVPIGSNMIAKVSLMCVCMFKSYYMYVLRIVTTVYHAIIWGPHEIGNCPNLWLEWNSTAPFVSVRGAW